MEPRIKIFARSFDLRLYRLSKRLYEDFGWECVRLTDQSADGYFYTMLKDMDCDIAVNVDEDAFITDIDAVRDLVELVIREGYANAGYSDGDSATNYRDKIVTNPFFNVLNLSLIREKFDRSAIRSRSFEDSEPYYPFFHWLAANFKTLYLPCKRHSDRYTTIGLDGSGRQICLHTWYSRFYSTPGWIVNLIDKKMRSQKARIDAVILEAYACRGIDIPVFGPLDKLSFIWNKIIRWTIKVPQRISRWPFKLRRKLHSK